MIWGDEGIQRLIESLGKKGHKVFISDEPYNLNIVGIRSTKQVPDTFNDWLVMFWKQEGKFIFGTYPFTTVPGTFYLRQQLLSKKGCAVLSPGQYLGAYKIGLHKGKYEALVQQKPVKVYRDSNRDDVVDYNPATLEQGLYGINIHRAYKSGAASKVGESSAGCQVFESSDDFAEFMYYCSLSKKQFGNKFTYTLIEEKDLT